MKFSYPARLTQHAIQMTGKEEKRQGIHNLDMLTPLEACCCLTKAAHVILLRSHWSRVA
jgi:hypothetical protein